MEVVLAGTDDVCHLQDPGTHKHPRDTSTPPIEPTATIHPPKRFKRATRCRRMIHVPTDPALAHREDVCAFGLPRVRHERILAAAAAMSAQLKPATADNKGVHDSDDDSDDDGRDMTPITTSVDPIERNGVVYTHSVELQIAGDEDFSPDRIALCFPCLPGWDKVPLRVVLTAVDFKGLTANRDHTTMNNIIRVIEWMWTVYDFQRLRPFNFSIKIATTLVTETTADHKGGIPLVRKIHMEATIPVQAIMRGAAMFLALCVDRTVLIPSFFLQGMAAMCLDLQLRMEHGETLELSYPTNHRTCIPEWRNQCVHLYTVNELVAMEIFILRRLGWDTQKMEMYDFFYRHTLRPTSGFMHPYERHSVNQDDPSVNEYKGVDLVRETLARTGCTGVGIPFTLAQPADIATVVPRNMFAYPDLDWNWFEAEVAMPAFRHRPVFPVGDQTTYPSIEEILSAGAAIRAMFFVDFALIDWTMQWRLSRAWRRMIARIGQAKLSKSQEPFTLLFNLPPQESCQVDNLAKGTHPRLPNAATMIRCINRKCRSAPPRKLCAPGIGMGKSVFVGQSCVDDSKTCSYHN